VSDSPDIKHVSSRDNPLLMQLRKQLKDPAAYRKSGKVWIEGEHLCQAAALKGLAIAQAVITDVAWAHSSLQALALRASSVVVIPSTLMSSISSLESPPSMGFVLQMGAMPTIQPGQATVILDRIQDPGNAGTILRSAAAFGFGQVVCLKGTVALWSPKVLRAGMGAHFSLHLVEGLEAHALAELAMPLLLSSPHAAQALHQATLPWPCAWVMGHEGQGVSEEVATHCTQQLRIAQPGGQESLNVASAAAICLYESARALMG